jgi:hypothetical protein
MDFFDKSGTEVLPGDIIIYGHNLGRCAGLRYGVVKEVKERQGYGDKKPIPVLRVRGYNDDWSHKKGSLCQKDGSLAFPERVLGVIEDWVPFAIFKALQDHYKEFKDGRA